MSVVSVEVKFFASLREAAGVGSCKLDLPEDANLEDVVRGVKERFPQLGDALEGIGIALNRRYMRRDELSLQKVRLGDEVALIPPISGG